jgi:hypothetical protein
VNRRHYLLLATALLCVALLPLVASSDEEARDDFTTLEGWTARPDWMGSAADPQAKAEVRDGIAHFTAGPSGRGMKWRKDFADIETGLAPWLVIRYRATGYPSSVDYLLWLGDSSKGRDGLRLIRGTDLMADGQWHTRAFDLSEAGAVAPVRALALACQAGGAPKAELWVDWLTFTDAPPTDAEGYRPPQGEGQRWPVSLGESTSWTAQPGWLGNYSPDSRVERTAEGLRFTVPEAGMGCKWSRALAEPVAGARRVAFRYRARGVGGSISDYALYVANQAGGRAPEEQYLVQFGDLNSDGLWHVCSAAVEVSSINALAVQVQATAPDASLEIADITFMEGVPVVRLAEVFPYTQGWPAETAGWRPVSLPPGNQEGLTLSTRLGFEGWIAGERITVQDIPFSLRSGLDAAVMTPIKDVGSIDFALDGKAAELYLVLAAKLPPEEEPSFGGGKLRAVRQVERFVAGITYADGTSEEQFPVVLPTGLHQITPGLAVYSLALDPAKDLRSVSLRDGMRNGAFGVVAATLSDRPGPATSATALTPTPAAPPRKAAKDRQTGFQREGDRLRFDAGKLSLVLEVAEGLRVVGIEDHDGSGALLGITPGPLFHLELGDQKVTSEDFRVESVRPSSAVQPGPVEISLVWDKQNPPVRVTVKIDPRPDASGELALCADCDTGGRDPLTTRLFFPELGGVSFSDKPDDTWYWMPRRGAIINKVTIGLRETYAGAGNPLQIMGTFAPRLGTGLYLMTRDLQAVPRFYRLQKGNAGVRLAVEWTPYGGDLAVWDTSAGLGRLSSTRQRQTGTPWVRLGCLQGDWHEQLERYRQWVAEWYTPAAPRKAWFREVFNFRQQFLHFGLPSPSGMFDAPTKTLRVKQVVDQDREAFGGVDYLHLFDWGWDPVHGRCGDYTPWDYLGGAEAFHKAVAEVKQDGTPVGLYIEGYLVDPPSDLGKAHGKDWQLLDAKGQPYTYFAPSYNICPWVKDWQDYLSATYARAKSQTGAVGFYIDEYGFSATNHLCYNPAHDHPLGATPILGEREMTRRVHEALGPESALYTEENPTDVNSQFQDGSFTYAISSVSDVWSPSHVNLYRFALPTFKTIEIITCDHPLGSNTEALRRILFNGEAVWLEGIADRWFTPEARAYIARSHKVLRDNRSCFAGDYPRPLVPTLLEGIYANEFAERADGRGKTCWTVYNTNFRTVRGGLLRVPYQPGAQYRDEMTGGEVSFRVAGAYAELSLEVGPRDVAVVSRQVPLP